MKLLLTLAWRNIWRNSRRSILTIAAVAFATTLSIAMRGILIGTFELNIRNVVRTFSGYIQIQRVGYQKNPSLHLSFPYDETLVSALSSEAEIVAFSPRIHADGLVSYGDQSLGAMVIGIAPEGERLVSNLDDRIEEGSFVASESSNDVVVGCKLLRNLRARVGDVVVVLAQGYDGSLGNMKYRIAGTIKTGSPEFDRMALFMGLSSIRELLGMTDRVHSVAIALKDLDRIDAVKERLQRAVADPKMAVLAWDEITPDLKKHLDMDQARSILFLWVLIAIVAFGILNTLLMSVTERYREFGVVLSMGMSNGKLAALVFLETLFITVVGLAAGNALGAGMNYYLTVQPIVIQGVESLQEEFGFVWQIESSLRAAIFVDTSVAVLGMSLLACIYPVHRVRKLEPLKGLRFT